MINRFVDNSWGQQRPQINFKNRKRHVKCDETKPSCQNCIKWRGYCDGYGVGGQDAPTASAQPKSKNTSAKLIHTKKAPLIIAEPDVNSIRFANAEQRGYFDSWTTMSVSFLSGGLVQTRLWTTTMPQVTLEEETLRYAAMAVGALRIALENSTVEHLDTDNHHYLNAVIYYCEALKLQSKAAVSRESLRTALLASLLFICFETQRGSLPAALKHMIHGFSMLNELAAGTPMAPDLVRIAPAPPAYVQEILDCYKPLELQSRSFLSSFRKIGFTLQKPVPSPDLLAPPIAPTTTAQNPINQQNLPDPRWGSGPSEPQVADGLPSPQSTGSPSDHQDPSSASSSLPPTHVLSQHERPPVLPAVPVAPPTMTGPPQGALPGLNTGGGPPPGGLPQGGPPRPPSIHPFTKNSPYFKPKESFITTLESLPPVFEHIDQSRGYWTLVQKQMVGTLPLLTAVTASLDLPRVYDETEFARKLGGIKMHPKIAKFVADSKYWLQRWGEAFDPLFRQAEANQHHDFQLYLEMAAIRAEYLLLCVYTTLPRFSGIVVAKSLTPQYREMVFLAERLLAARPHCGFAMDSGWTWPLFVVAFGCRDREVREYAMGMLGRYPIRNLLRDSRVFRAIALRCQMTEYATMMEGTEVEQWLRLRRREVVFEHFGMHIIYRSAQKNQVTGAWEMVEEIADYHVNPDGTLNWRPQPVTDAVSILSGAC